MEQEWRRIDEENERLFEKQMEESKKSSAADHSFFTAPIRSAVSLRVSYPTASHNPFLGKAREQVL